MDEKYQYGNAMAKPLPYSCIKTTKWKTEDKIGRLFYVDIKFNEKLANEKVLLFNEIFTPLFKKKVS